MYKELYGEGTPCEYLMLDVMPHPCFLLVASLLLKMPRILRYTHHWVTKTDKQTDRHTNKGTYRHSYLHYPSVLAHLIPHLVYSFVFYTRHQMDLNRTVKVGPADVV